MSNSKTGIVVEVILLGIQFFFSNKKKLTTKINIYLMGVFEDIFVFSSYGKWATQIIVHEMNCDMKNVKICVKYKQKIDLTEIVVVWQI